MDAGSEAAIQRLFSLKGRDKRHPILILIPSAESLSKYVTCIPSVAEHLIQEFWPGGLTLIFQASAGISPLLTGGAGKIGVRLSSHPVPTALAQSIRGPVTGTSANPSGAPPCRYADEVKAYFGKRIDLIIDDGETTGETGSTVLDLTVDPPGILREGMISQEKLENLIGKLQVGTEHTQ